MRIAKNIFLIILLIITTIIVLVRLENYNRNTAIERCGGEDNIEIAYTNTGDRYYICKNK